MAEYLITIKAQDGTTQVFKAISSGAQKMGDELEKAGQKAKKGADDLDSFSKKATAMGAGIGTAVSALSLLGQASVSQQRELDALNRLYGDSADQIIAFTEAIQDNTTYSNEQARDAATTAATLANNYSFTADQIEQLITVSADLATTQGTSLTYATDAVSAAMRGEAEQAEGLGLTLNDQAVAAFAASEGIEGYSTTLTDAERAQVRFDYLLVQSASSYGAAGAAAETTAGQAKQFLNSVQDGAVALGDFIGPAAEMASVLAPSVLALPLVGAGLGKVGTSALTAGRALAGLRVGGLAVGAALGPIGLAAVGIGAVALAFKAIGDSADDAREATDGLAAALAGAATSTTFGPDTFNDIASGISDALALEINELNSNNTGGGFNLSGLAGSLSSSLVDAFADNPELAGLSNQLTDIVNYAFNSGAVNASAVVDELFNLNSALSTGAIQLPEYRAGSNRWPVSLSHSVC